jgi:protein O-GlcNAc transferase
MTLPEAFEFAVQHHRAGQLADAEALYRQILSAQPHHADALHMLGVIAHQAGRHDLAVELILKAIVLNPINAAAHSNLGEVYRALGRIDDAITHYRHAIRLQPNYPQAHNNLGNALMDRKQLDEAAIAFRRALAIRPDYPDAHTNLGIALARLGELDNALAAFRRAIHLQPDHPLAHSYLIYTLHFHPGHSVTSIAEERQRWNRQFSAPLKRFILPHANDLAAAGRLRIGYVSPDFRDHVVGRNLLPLFRCHDRGQFEILCYSGVLRPDRFTDEFRGLADQWRGTVGVGEEALAEIIRRDKVDILVDLTQHMTGNRLSVFARKPAPVQVSFACYPESTGLETIEYRISDRRLEAEAVSANQGIGNKERVHLIDSYWCYDPCGLELEVNELPARNSGRVTFGCLNNFSKINGPVLALYARVLSSVADSRLILMAGLGSQRQRTVEALEREGVETHRLEFVEHQPRRGYLALYHRIDIVLDSFPYNGHTTSLDALSMGVPVVSLAGSTSVSRAGLSQLTNLGLPDLVAHSEMEYVNIAADLAMDLPRLTELRSTLRDRMKNSVLMDAPRFARQVEQAYREMWRAWCNNKSPLPEMI